MTTFGQQERALYQDNAKMHPCLVAMGKFDKLQFSDSKLEEKARMI